VGVAAPGLPDWLAGRITSRHRREALKALGNSVVAACAEVIGRAILAAAGGC
jgi:site-specific DNA-cytosine methylase